MNGTGRIPATALALAALALLVSCSAKLPPPATPAPPVPETRPSVSQPIETPTISSLRTEVRQWMGTPHRLGGRTKKGVDCSAFVQQVLRKVYGLSVPRTTRLQIRSGRPVEQITLQAGDLVFFHIEKKTMHVGIYLGNDEFAHASVSKGVTLSSLKSPYWKDAYLTARRVLPDAS